jgi:predicted phosphodiesterase
MPLITFVGDVHGHVQSLNQIIQRHEKHNPVIQVGDIGIGFNGKDNTTAFASHSNFFFIRGNHDNPEQCRKNPRYLGDFGYNSNFNLFYISGAWSIDQNMRLEGRDWWPEEELSMAQCGEVVDLWLKIKPDYVVTHEGPYAATHSILGLCGGRKINTRTGQLLDQLWEYHKPQLWIFGHWHVSKTQIIKGTEFITLAELEEKTLQIPAKST